MDMFEQMLWMFPRRDEVAEPTMESAFPERLAQLPKAPSAGGKKRRPSAASASISPAAAVFANAQKPAVPAGAAPGVPAGGSVPDLIAQLTKLREAEAGELATHAKNTPTTAYRKELEDWGKNNKRQDVDPRYSRTLSDALIAFGTATMGSGGNVGRGAEAMREAWIQGRNRDEDRADKSHERAYSRFRDTQTAGQADMLSSEARRKAMLEAATKRVGAPIPGVTSQLEAAHASNLQAQKDDAELKKLIEQYNRLGAIQGKKNETDVLVAQIGATQRANAVNSKPATAQEMAAADKLVRAASSAGRPITHEEALQRIRSSSRGMGGPVDIPLTVLDEALAGGALR